MTNRPDDHKSDGSRVHIRGLSPGDVALFRNLADEAAEKAVNKTFIAMGLDPSEPLVSQRYFQVLRDLTDRIEDDSADAAWTRRWRERSEGLFGKAMISVFGLAVVGAANALWTGFKAAMASPPPLPH
jgi:hypothetical protein